MPITRCKVKGKLGYKWGQSGKCYVGFGAREKAEHQATAIYAQGWTGNAKRLKRRRGGNLLRNVFCPTGPGGGKDPTCSPGEAADRTEDSWAMAFRVGDAKYKFLAEKRALPDDVEGSSTWDVVFFLQTGGPGFGKHGVDLEGLGMTKTGRPVQVLTTAIDRLQRFISDVKPDRFFFGASEPTRRRVYDKIARRVSFPGYEREQIKRHGRETGEYDIVDYVYRRVSTANTKKPKRRRGGNPLRFDPTRTKTLRRVFQQEMKRRINLLKKDIHDLIVTENAFGLLLREPLKFNKAIENYDPDQPRDEQGQWTSGGGSSGSGRLEIPEYVDKFGEKPTDSFHAQFRYENYRDSRKAVEDYLSGRKPLASYTNGEYTVVITQDSRSLFLRAGDSHPAPSGHWMGFHDPDLTEIGVSQHAYGKMSRAGKAAADAKVQAIKYAPGQFQKLRDSFWNQGRVENLAVNTRFAFQTTPQKLEAFRKWLKQQMQLRMLGDELKSQDDWWHRYVAEGYRKGAGRAFDDTRPQVKEALGRDAESVSDFYAGTKEEFLRSAFARPVSIEKVKLLAGRVYTDIKGVSDQTAAKLSRRLTDGMVQGEHPVTIARDMDGYLNAYKNQAMTVARTEISRAYVEGELDSMERLGVEEVGVMVEWTVASGDGVSELGYPSPCDLCAPLGGVVLKIGEARGMFPRHPDCMCALTPANFGEKDEDQIRGKSAVEKALDESIMAEGGKSPREKTSWMGADREISETRPESLLD